MPESIEIPALSRSRSLGRDDTGLASMGPRVKREGVRLPAIATACQRLYEPSTGLR